MPEFSASSTAAFSSSRENCSMWIGSVGEATPPLAMIFTKRAPDLISSRAARRTSGTPSQSRPSAPST